MQEALGGAFRRVLEGDYYTAKARMDGLKPSGRMLYDEANAMLRSDPVTVVFQHSAFFTDESGKIIPGDLDIQASVHLETDPLIDFPGHVRKPGIVILAEFSGPYDGHFSDPQRMFAIAEDGDTINHQGNFVTAQEMGQVESIIFGFRTP